MALLLVCALAWLLLGKGMGWALAQDRPADASPESLAVIRLSGWAVQIAEA